MLLNALKVSAYLLVIMDSHQKFIMTNYHRFLSFFVIPINIKDVHFFFSILLLVVLYKLLCHHAQSWSSKLVSILHFNVYHSFWKELLNVSTIVLFQWQVYYGMMCNAQACKLSYQQLLNVNGRYIMAHVATWCKLWTTPIHGSHVLLLMFSSFFMIYGFIFYCISGYIVIVGSNSRESLFHRLC
jgi:hypothetical protein